MDVGESQYKCGDPEHTLGPISGSAEVSGVSSVYKDLCAVFHTCLYKIQPKPFTNPGGLLKYNFYRKTYRLIYLTKVDDFWDDHEEIQNPEFHWAAGVGTLLVLGSRTGNVCLRKWLEWFGLILAGNDRVGNGSHIWKNVLTPFKHHRVQSKTHTVSGGTVAQGY